MCVHGNLYATDALCPCAFVLWLVSVVGGEVHCLQENWRFNFTPSSRLGYLFDLITFLLPCVFYAITFYAITFLHHTEEHMPTGMSGISPSDTLFESFRFFFFFTFIYIFAFLATFAFTDLILNTSY